MRFLAFFDGLSFGTRGMVVWLEMVCCVYIGDREARSAKYLGWVSMNEVEQFTM